MSWLFRKKSTEYRVQSTEKKENTKGLSPKGTDPKYVTKGTVPKILVVILSLLFFAQLSWAAMGLETNPGQIDVTGVPLGKKIAVSKLTTPPVYLEIKNKSDAAYDYEINILHTAQTTSPLRQGFIDMPDTNWIMPEKKAVRVEARSAKEVELYIYIPNKKAYANKKYQAIIEVKNKKNNPQDLFVLACQLRITLQTEKKQEGWFRGWLK